MYTNEAWELLIRVVQVSLIGWGMVGGMVAVAWILMKISDWVKRGGNADN